MGSVWGVGIDKNGFGKLENNLFDGILINRIDPAMSLLLKNKSG